MTTTTTTITTTTATTTTTTTTTTKSFLYLGWHNSRKVNYREVQERDKNK